MTERIKLKDFKKRLPAYVVGIDPGTHTGVGILRSDGSFWTSSTKDFFSVQDFLCSLFGDRSEVKIFVELPAKFIYSRNRGTDDKARGGDMQAMHIGGNRRESELLKIALKRLGFDVQHVFPVRETKWDQRRFELFTKCTKRTSEHERDAVRLAAYYLNK